MENMEIKELEQKRGKTGILTHKFSCHGTMKDGTSEAAVGEGTHYCLS